MYVVCFFFHCNKTTRLIVSASPSGPLHQRLLHERTSGSKAKPFNFGLVTYHCVIVDNLLRSLVSSFVKWDSDSIYYSGFLWGLNELLNVICLTEWMLMANTLSASITINEETFSSHHADQAASGNLSFIWTQQRRPNVVWSITSVQC